MSNSCWKPSELVRLAWAARRDSAARADLLQALQSGADIRAPLTSQDLGNDPFGEPGDCVVGIVIRELTGSKEAEPWLRLFLRAYELHQGLPPAEIIAGPTKRRF